MPIEIVLPLLLVPLVVGGGLALYRRALRRLQPDTARAEVSGIRLTSAHLRHLDAPPWRVVYEVGDGRLGDVDHVVVGPAGVIAVTSVVTDRPAGDVGSDPLLTAAAATTRARVEELVAPAGAGCGVLAKVFWGQAQPDRPAALALSTGVVAVEGQRLNAWLASLPSTELTAAEVDRAWHAVTTGIGRPDPLA